MKILREALGKIFQHCLEGYPYECCGLMIGIEENGRTVLDAVKASNVYAGDRRVRYLIDPMEYYRVERGAEGRGLRVLGVYHSHPNVPARPSAYDIEQFFPWYTYLIVSVSDAGVVEYRVWRLEEGGSSRPVEDSLEIS
ncbi:MAG: M67 family metallopeptidase [Nitrososphaerota archaeon]